MRTRFVEATQDALEGFNHGKFAVALFDEEERARRCEVDYRVHERLGMPDTKPPERSLLGRCGWTSQHVFVMDLQTGEGAMFLPGGLPSADLAKHRVWVCPMFEPFLAWLYEFVWMHNERVMVERSKGVPADRGAWFDALPALVEIPGVPGEMAGYRREGPVGRPTREQTERWRLDPQIVPLSATRPGDDEPELQRSWDILREAGFVVAPEGSGG